MQSLSRMKHKRRWRGRSGSEVLEMALALPLLLLLAFGTIEFGYWFYLEHNFQAAAREAARAAIVSTLTSPEQRTEAANAAAELVMNSINLPQGKYTVNCLFSDPDTYGATYMTVEVEANWADVGVETGLFVQVRGGDETEFVQRNNKISGSATMRIES